MHWGHTLAPWGGELDVLHVYFATIGFVLVNGLCDSVVPICIHVDGIYMLEEAGELTPFNVDGIYTENRYLYVWVLIGTVVPLFVE
jgi:hypothetical protein